MKDFKIDDDKKIETGFIVPENYFDDLFEKVNQKIVKEPKIISIFRKPKFWFSAVAAVFIIGFSVVMFVNNRTNIDEKIEMTSLEESFTDDEIAELLTENDLLALETELQKNDRESEQIINNYL